ncbi:MAG: cytochrome c3 family protein [Actinomycetota bacterium]|nr:cytochrome c3 family protein [Actinomycetota bacterium]
MAGKAGRGPGRFLSIAVAMFVFATLVGFAAQASAVEIGIDDETLTIDVGGEVFSEKCDPCHANIANTGNYAQEIIFSHGYHQLIACSGCHTRFPHRPEGTERPTMTGCFACHGLNHGPMGSLATGKCEDCHNTDRERMRPSFHTRDWAEEPHVIPGETRLQTQCMMCHDQASCDDCHEDEFIVWEPEEAFEYDSDGGCLACHGDENLTKNSDGRPKSFQVLGVDDSAHREFSCQACHQDYRYDSKIMPTPLWQINAGFACQECHESEDPESTVAEDYMSSIHGTEIAKGNLDSATCSSCHGGHYIRRLDTEAAQ